MVDNDRGILLVASAEGPPFDTLNWAGSGESEISASLEFVEPVCIGG